MARPICTVGGCSNTINARGLCNKHYKRKAKYGDVNEVRDARYMTRETYLSWRSVIEPGTGCWIWTGPIGANGYGTASRNNKKVSAHRLSYSTLVGNIPSGHDIRHKCDTRACINPDHLETGTRAENNRDTSVRGRHGNAKLSNDDVIDIRWSHGLGASGSSLAHAYGVTPTLISQIVNRKARTNI